MLPSVTLPASLAALLGALRPCFTARSFVTFCGLAAGLAGQARRRTVCGMLLGACLARAWPHDRAHYFFARARWDIDELGLAVARLVVLLLVPPGDPLTVAVDDSVFRRSGRTVHAAGWQHDGSSPSRNRLSFGTCFVTCGVVVRLPFCTRPVCLPVLARLILPGKKTRGRPPAGSVTPGTRVWAAAALVTLLAAAFPGRAVHAVADAAYHGPALKDLPAAVTWTTRLPANAVLYDLARPKKPGTPGRPARKGPRLGTAAGLAAAASWTRAAVPAYGRTQDSALAAVTCLWYGCLGTRTVRVILARTPGCPLLALVTTDLGTPAAALVTRYAARWSIEQAFADARNILGAGEARNRTRPAVERTVPFALLVSTLVITWYARHGHDPARITARRHAQPWYTAKTEPAFEDMLTHLRHVLICARISAGSPAQPTPEQTKAVLAAWHAAAA
jgi:DDE superfamily endonuclease